MLFSVKFFVGCQAVFLVYKYVCLNAKYNVGNWSKWTGAIQ